LQRRLSELEHAHARGQRLSADQRDAIMCMDAVWSDYDCATEVATKRDEKEAQ